MSKALANLMERNLVEVFGQVDSAQRAAAIAELYTADCTFFEAEEKVTGREALNAKVGDILKDALTSFCCVRRALYCSGTDCDVGKQISATRKSEISFPTTCRCGYAAP
jgi:hypothetical protein